MPTMRKNAVSTVPTSTESALEKRFTRATRDVGLHSIECMNPLNIQGTK
ncbi:hypothetical protein SynROS8604_02125 [Synechococcus sp. ROS8604]|nr:hypothetical protein SynROS8604_02125 [Synechococcus sp. ROS8604]